MKIIAFGGQLASGKDTAADMLYDYLEVADSHDWRRTAFAINVKKILMETFNVDWEFIEKWKRALIEATAFGARAIIERMRQYGVPIERIVCCGGIAEKNPLLMQIYADVTGCTMQTSSSDQTCALGASLAAAVAAGSAAGGYDDFAEAQARMTSVNSQDFAPDPASKRVYDELYGLYLELHDAFGGVRESLNLSQVMKQLLTIKKQAAGHA